MTEKAGKSAVYAGFHPPICPCDFRTVFEGRFPPDKESIRSQQVAVFRKPWNWERPNISHDIQGKPWKSGPSTVF
jgi:hypothetical protein